MKRCEIQGCDRPRSTSSDMCTVHEAERVVPTPPSLGESLVACGMSSSMERDGYVAYRAAAAELLDAEARVREARARYVAACTRLNEAIEENLPKR